MSMSFCAPVLGFAMFNLREIVSLREPGTVLVEEKGDVGGSLEEVSR